MAQSNFYTEQYTAEQLVESCGAILFDATDSRAMKVCLIRLQDTTEWMLPKGRRNIGEARQDAAVREVYEETGYRCHLLPVSMSTRACAVDAPANAADIPRWHDNVTEPFMYTLRHLTPGNGVKLICWFIAALESDGHQVRGPGEAELEAKFFPLEEAHEHIHFAQDRELLFEAIRLARSTKTHSDQQ